MCRAAVFTHALCIVALQSSLPPATAEIRYTNPADFTIGVGQSRDIDIDQNGTPEIRILNQPNDAFDVSILPLAAGVECVAWTEFDFVERISAGTSIDSGLNFVALDPFLGLSLSGLTYWEFCDCTIPYGRFEGDTGFIAIRLREASQSRYAWIRCRADSGMPRLFDYAIEMTPNAPIVAGDPEPGPDCGIFPGAALQLFDSRALAPWSASPAAVTIEVWMRWTPLGDEFDNVCFLVARGFEHMELHTGGAAGPRGLRFIPTDGVYLDTPSDALTIDRWVHIAAVYDPAAEQAAIYLNGEAQPLISRGANPIGTPLAEAAAEQLAIGWRPDYFLPFEFRGLIDDLRIWGVARSRDQIVADFRSEIDPASPGLLAYYRCDEGAGGVIADATPNLFAAQHPTQSWTLLTACCAADLDLDADVDLSDLTRMLAHFGQMADANYDDGDLDGNGAVDLTDLTILLAGFGHICS